MNSKLYPVSMTANLKYPILYRKGWYKRGSGGMLFSWRYL